MGRIGHRLAGLEEEARRQAAEQIRDFWLSLTEREEALLVAPFLAGREPESPEEQQIAARAREQCSEEVLERAVGRNTWPDMPQSVLSSRMTELMAPVRDPKRTARVRALVESLEGELVWQQLREEP